MYEDQDDWTTESRLLSSSSVSYPKAVALYRDTLLQEFSHLYGVLCGALEAHLGKRVVLAPGPYFGLPAFHVIPSHQAWSLSVFAMHTDETFTHLISNLEKAYGEVPMDVSTCDRESRISYTLPLRLPGGETAAGLNFVDFSSCEDADDPAECGTQAKERYEVGTLVIHSQALLHQIGEWDYSSYNDTRITLQGFGFRCSDTWYLYW